MKKVIAHLIILSFLLSIVASCGHTEKRLPAQYSQTDEVLVNVGIPFKTIEREVMKLAGPKEVLRKIDYVRIDPLTRILSIKGVVNYPLEKLFNFGVPLPTGTAAAENHVFELAISFPEAKELSQTRYFRIKFHRFKVNGDDYLNGFSIVGSFIQTIMANTELIRYVYNQASSALPKNTDSMTMMKQVIETDGFVVNPTTKTIAVKLNTSYFSQLQMYDEIENLRLWYFGPDLLSGTKDYAVFRLIAGIGKPSDRWVTQQIADVNSDDKTILEIRNELYKLYSNHTKIGADLVAYFEQILGNEKVAVTKLPTRYQKEIENFKAELRSAPRSVLVAENQLFQADPENEYLNFIENEKGRARFFMTDLDRRLSIDNTIRNDADLKNKNLPILTKKISQDLLNSSMNFIRDTEDNGQYYVKEANFILAPNLPGIILRGKLNLDLNYLLGQIDSSFVGKKIDNNKSWDADGIPFEIVVETNLGKDGWLGIDPKSIKLFDGEKKLQFSRSSKNQQFFLDFIKVYLSQTLAAMNYDTTELNDTPEKIRERRIKDLSDYLKGVKDMYGSVANKPASDAILKSMEFDIKMNPANAAGAAYMRKKGQILFSDLFKYDAVDKLFKIKLDPKLVFDSIEGADNTLQVWGLAPYVSKDLNNTFLEVSVGEGPRGRNYVDSLESRASDLDNAGFSGIYQDFNQSSADFIASINFLYLETYTNHLFQSMLKLQNAQYEKELLIDKEQSHTLLDNLTLKVTADKRITLNLKVSTIEKKKAMFGWIRDQKWKVVKDSYSLSAELSLNSRKLSQIKDQLREDKLPIYYNDDAIGVTLHKVKVEFGKPSLINSTLSKLTNLNLDLPLVNKLNTLLLKIVSMYFNSQYKDDRLLSGSDIEEMVKVLTTDKEIILLLNPRLAGSAFEVKLAASDDYIDQALKFDTKNQEMHMVYTTATSMAKIDKRELASISTTASSLIDPYLKMNNADLIKAMNKDLLIDKIIRASDKSKLSVYNRLVRLMSHYDPVLNVTGMASSSKKTEQRLTAGGSELMYFAGTSYLVHSKLDALVKKIEASKMQKEVLFFETLVEGRNKMRDLILNPLYRKYKADHHQINESVLKNYRTFWTYQFYPDAYFSESIYQVLSN